MEKNLKYFLIKLGLFTFLLFLIRALFQTPVEYFGLTQFYESYSNRLFSKGDAMKVIAFAGVVFTLYFRGALEKIAHPRISIIRSIALFIGANASVALYYGLRYYTNIYNITQGGELFFVLALKLFSLALSALLLLMSIFQLEYLFALWGRLSKPIILTGIFIPIFYSLLMFFQEQWRFFSQIVADNLLFLFNLFYDATAVPSGAGTILTVDHFTVAVGAACSGIDSMLLFFALFLVIFSLDYKEIKTIPFIFAFILGIFLDFLVNNLRVFLLILVGIHISPELAVGLFHTHAGWIMFLLFFMVYYWLIKKFIYKKRHHERK